MMFLPPEMIAMKEQLLKDVISKTITVNYAAKVLGVTRKTIHKLKCRYKYYGVNGLIPLKSGPKNGKTWNKISQDIEDLVVQMAFTHKREGPVRLMYKLEDEYGIHIDQSTIYRILKRRGVKYYVEYKREKKPPKLYVLSFPGEELQVDTWYPFGRHRKFVIYSAIDDCTRIVYSKAYETANSENTKNFVQELIRRYPFTIRSLRTDQGREFAKSITIYLESLGIKHIKNEPYHPEHNGKIERYHQTESDNEVSKRPYLISIPEANYRLWQRTTYYNYNRRHTGLGMNGLTPMNKRKKIAFSDYLFPL